MAGIEATSLYFKLGQVMELEIEIPTWWVYLAFPSRSYYRIGTCFIRAFSIA